MLARTALVLAALLATSCPATAFARHSHKLDAQSSAPAASKSPGQYDYYVMALSWSPTFCRTHQDEQDQCGHKGYGFVLHGLWPQYENGGGPQHCSSDDKPDRRTVNATLPFMPSRRLINHEWFTHGACTGLTPEQYFGLADRAYAAVQVPPELKAPRRDVQTTADELRTSLKRANPGLADNMLSLHCSQGELVEVRICLDKDQLSPRACGERMRTGCPVSAPFTLPATR